MKTYHFAPKFSVARELRGVFSIAEMEKEQGVYSATPQFVRRNCGPIANMFLDGVPDSYYAEAERRKLWPNIDIRVHRLYPGDYPAYPGWHCDGELRENYFSQPDLDRTPVSEHPIATASTNVEGVSNTQFLDQPFSVTLEPHSRDRLGSWTKEMRAETEVAEREFKLLQIEEMRRQLREYEASHDQEESVER